MNDVLFMRCELQELAAVKELMFGMLVIFGVEALLMLIIIYKLFNND